MARLGYQKYLQKIYVSIDADAPLLSANYQLPIVVAILDAVGMLRLRQDIYSIGRFLADYSISYPSVVKESKNYFPNLFSTKTEEGERIEKYLNKIHTAAEKLLIPEYSIQDLFPGVIFENDKIAITRTPLDILKRISDSTISVSLLSISLRHKSLSEQKIKYLESLPHANKVFLDYKKCFCEKEPCVCTKKERILHTEQLLILKEYSGNY